jgi:hypothetical protein
MFYLVIPLTNLICIPNLILIIYSSNQSIITIGSSSVCDIGKGIQNLMIKGLKTVDELDQQTIIADAETDTSRIQSNNRTSSSTLNSRISAKGSCLNEASFPHFSVPTDLSPSYARSQWSALHKEDDVLVRRKCFYPQVRLSCLRIRLSLKFEINFCRLIHLSELP